MKVLELIRHLETCDPDNQVYVEEDMLIYGLDKRKIRQRVVDNIPGVYIDLKTKEYKDG